MNKYISLILMGIVSIVVGGCVFASGRTLERTVMLSIPSDNYALRTEWQGATTILSPSSNHVYKFQTPAMRSGTTYWLGVIPNHYIHGDNEPFLYVTKDGKEWRALTPRQLWNLPKNTSGISVLRE